MVTASYVLNELDESFFDSFANHIWNKSGKYILIVEPGTPKGFSNIKKIRDKFITLGGNVMSPCPHNNSCPITENDWCHFYSRVSRTKTQRFLKSADESYEDEKFSYILISKSIVKHSKPRIIRHPKYFKGHLELELCTENGIKNVRLSKKDKEKYKSARKSDWGMMFEI